MGFRALTIQNETRESKMLYAFNTAFGVCLSTGAPDCECLGILGRDSSMFAGERVKVDGEITVGKAVRPAD